MYCSECGKHNPEDSKFCQHCGFSFDDHGDENGTSNFKTSDKSPFPYVISTTKLVVLSTATFGIYDIYWFYKQWKSLKEERDIKLTPWARALFAVFTSYSLFKEITRAVKSVDKTRSGLEAGLLAITYFILVSLWKLPEPYWWLSMFSVLPLIPAQKAINFYWDKKYGNKVIASSFGAWNYILTIVGGIILLLALYNSFNSSSNLGSTSSVNDSTTTTAAATSNPKAQSQLGSYNQDKVVSSVVNIFCESTVASEETSGGSGTILSEDGTILTNAHVIPHDKTYHHVVDKGCLVVLPDSQTGQPKEIYWAKPVLIPSVSDKYDLAYVTIYSAYYDTDTKKYQGVYPKKFPAFDDTTRCTNKNVQLGESVRIFGYPAISGGYTLTITDGLVSSFPGAGLIVTSAKISHGNSGGLAVDKNGCMIGVPSLVSSDESESLGVIYSMDIVNNFSKEVETFLNKK